MAATHPLDAARCTTQVRAEDIPEQTLAHATAEGELSARIAPQGRAVEALRRGLAERAPGFNVAVVGKRGTGRTFTAIALARAEAIRRPAPRDLVLLLDTSGSMDGEPIAQAQRIASALVASLDDADGLEIIEFSSAPRRFRRESVRATAAHRKAAIACLLQPSRCRFCA